jgi:hypothetical protein
MKHEALWAGAQSPTGEFMKLIRILIVALFTVSCSRASTPEGTDRKSHEGIASRGNIR